MRMANKRQSIRIAIFNHKGGVGKTTITLNLAAALGERGKSVLLVDSDPQCNLTSHLFDDEVVDQLLDDSDSDAGETIWSAVKPVVESVGPVKAVKPQPSTFKNCLVIPGDIRLSELELELATYWSDCLEEKVKGFNGTAVLSMLVDRVSAKAGADYVFYDTGPNIGPLNRAILLDCDYFIVPAAADLFSVRALRTLGKTISTWIRRWHTIQELAPDGSTVLRGRPALLGYVMQGYKVYGGGMSRSAARARANFEKRLAPDLLKPLRKIDPQLAPQTASEARLGDVKNFTTLVQQSQEQGVALWGVYGAPSYQVDDSRTMFMKLADEVIKRTT